MHIAYKKGEIMELIKELLRKNEKIDFLFPNSFYELMNNDYYDYDKFEWFLYYVFKLDGAKVEKLGKKGKGDGGADIIVSLNQGETGFRRIGIQAKYWKNRVGSEPINQLASAQARLDLSDLWIITTSDLTSDAKKIAESLDINVLRGEDVSEFIQHIKRRYNDDIKNKGESVIKFLDSKNMNFIKEKSFSKNNKKCYCAKDISEFKKLRNQIAKKYKLYPIYTVFNNEVLVRIIEKKPKTKAELSNVKGLGPKKIEQFGNEIIEFVKNYYCKPNTPKEKYETDDELLNILLSERKKIAKYNKMEENDVYSDKVAAYIAKMKPLSKVSLSKIFGFDTKNIDIFGDYLIKIIDKYVKNNIK